MAMKEIIKIVKLLGLRQAAKMKRHHDIGLAYIRGYTATSCWWALLNCGFLDDLQAHGYLNIDQYVNDRNHNHDDNIKTDNIKADSANTDSVNIDSVNKSNRNHHNGSHHNRDNNDNGCGNDSNKSGEGSEGNKGNGTDNSKNSNNIGNYDDCSGCCDSSKQKIVREVFNAIIEYLNGVGLLETFGQSVRLSKTGQVLLAEPRGLYELLLAYEPCFCNLPALLSGEKTYGREVTRNVPFVGIGSGRLCEQLPYPIMRSMILSRNCRMVIDLGCGDMALDAGLCRLNAQICCHGIDFSSEMIHYNQQQLQKNNYNGRLTVQKGNIFALGKLNLPDKAPPVDCITACDTFHEYLNEPQKIINLLKNLQHRFPGVLFVIGEFCLQDAKWLRKHPTASLEHHLFHQLSNQQIGSADQWRKIFLNAGLKIVDEQVFDIIGHGYFALRA